MIAGDITPIDVISHLPVYCENNSIPYIFVQSKADLGAAAATKRPTSCVLVQELPSDAPDKITSKWKEILSGISELASAGDS